LIIRVKTFGIKTLRLYFCTPLKEKADLVAQLVEHNTFNVGAQGSNPCGITKYTSGNRGFFIVNIHAALKKLKISPLETLR
jgi:hypothetical protein